MLIPIKGTLMCSISIALFFTTKIGGSREQSKYLRVGDSGIIKGTKSDSEKYESYCLEKIWKLLLNLKYDSSTMLGA